ncbi:MAG: type II toxin-antitoxin system Phd/YefM family antitoxin [Thermoanaerobaculia bacterium]|nr:type II toxin-antitoxin system Phd/YefM family antitoxin [Thermoanaerobaculia bacterium]
MKPMQISRDIVPLAKFKSQASQIFRQLRDEKRPVVVTQHGQPAAVLITPEEFDRLQEHDRFLAAVQEGLADSEAGRLIEDEDLAADLDAEFGP